MIQIKIHFYNHLNSGSTIFIPMLFVVSEQKRPEAFNFIVLQLFSLQESLELVMIAMAQYFFSCFLGKSKNWKNKGCSAALFVSDSEVSWKRKTGSSIFAIKRELSYLCFVYHCWTSHCVRLTAEHRVPVLCKQFHLVPHTIETHKYNILQHTNKYTDKQVHRQTQMQNKRKHQPNNQIINE